MRRTGNHGRVRVGPWFCLAGSSASKNSIAYPLPSLDLNLNPLASNHRTSYMIHQYTPAGRARDAEMEMVKHMILTSPPQLPSTHARQLDSIRQHNRSLSLFHQDHLPNIYITIETICAGERRVHIPRRWLYTASRG
jgi:hypothetical protein